MKIYKRIGSRLTPEERETIFAFDNFDKVWIMDSTIPKHFNKALKQGWTPISQGIYEDGTIFSMKLTAPEHAITIRNTAKKTMSEKQMKNLTGSDDNDDE